MSIAKWRAGILLSLAIFGGADLGIGAIGVAYGAPDQELAKAAAADLYGDPLPAGAVRRFGTTRWRQATSVNFVGFTSGGKQLVTSGWYGQLRVWDVSTGTEVRRLEQPGLIAPMVVLSADGQMLAAASDTGAVWLWDLATFKVTAQVPTNAKKIVGFGLAPDKKSLLTQGADLAVNLWDTSNGKLIRQLGGPLGERNYSGFGNTAACAPDGQTVAWVSIEQKGMEEQAAVVLWDVATGKERGRTRARPDPRACTHIGFSADSKLLACQDAAGACSVYDVQSTKELKELPKDPPGRYYHNGLAFSPDSKLLARISRPRTIQLWDVEKHKEVRRLDMDGITFISLSFSPDGKALAAAGAQAVQLWNVTSGRPLQEFRGHHEDVTVVRLMPDGKTLFTFGSDRSLRQWDTQTGRETHRLRLPSQWATVSLARAGQTVAFSDEDRSICVMEVATGKKLQALPAARFGASFALSPDGKTLAISEEASIRTPPTVRLVEIATGKETRHEIAEAGRGPLRISFAPDGGTLALQASAGQTDTVFWWSLASEKKVRELGPVGRLSLSVMAPNGKTMAFLHADQKMILWEVATGKERGSFPTGRFTRVASISPDGRLLAICVEKEVRLWDAPARTEIGVLRGHTGKVTSVTYGLDGQTLFSGSEDTTVLVWDLADLLAKTRGRTVELKSEQLQALWADLAGPDAAKAFAAIGTLNQSPAQAVAFLQEQLKPVTIDAKRLAQWITDLDSREQRTRQDAAAALEKLAEAVHPVLKEALAKQPSQEVRQQIEKLLEATQPDRIPPAKSLRGLRAVETLEQIGTSEARRLLTTLAGGAPAARLTLEAKAAVERLGQGGK